MIAPFDAPTARRPWRERPLMQRALAVVTIVLLARWAGSDVPAPEVKTAAGGVRGTSTPDGRIRIFKGIPYAAPPVGERRWKEPQKAAAWAGVRDAREFGAQCVQAPVFGDITFARPASEDCLTLNVWTPAATT